MCGRFVDAHSSGDIAELLRAERIETNVRRPAYNITPTQQVRIVVDHLDSATGAVERILADAEWTFQRPWDKNNALKNAKSETVATLKTFRHAVQYGRAVMPATGYYEWRAEEGGKQPYYLSSPDGQPLWLAALYEWRKGSGEETQRPFSTILTAAAPEPLAFIHHRVPVILPESLIDRWLDPALTDLNEIDAILGAVPDPELDFYPVSKAVNNGASQGEQLIERAG